MNAQERIEREVEETIACFKKADRIEAGPWFHARLMGRIQASKRQERTLPWVPGLDLLRPVLTVAIVIVNAFAVALVLKGGVPEGGSRETRLAALAERYSIDRDAYGFFRIGDEVRR